MKVLVTGGAGFIGSHVVEELARSGHSIVIVDNLSSGRIENISDLLVGLATLEKCDIRNVFNLTDIFRKSKPEVVIHLAAQPSIVFSQESPFIDLAVNGMGTLNVIHAAQEGGAKRIVFASTSAVYPSDVRICMEALTPHPESPYGVSKMVAEHYLRLYGNATILRLGNVYGPRQVPLGENQVIPRMIRHRLYGDPFSIHGDGKQIRDYVYVKDVARAFLSAMPETGFHVYNIASGKRGSVNMLVAFMNDILGENYEWPHDDQDDPRREVNLSVEEAQYRLKWHAETRILDGLRETVEWWKEKNVHA